MVQVFFAGNALLGHLTVHGAADPLVFSLYRDIGGSAVMLFLASTWGPWRVPTGTWELLNFSCLGLVGVCGTQTIGFVALQYVSSSMFTLLQLLQPVLMPLVACVCRQEVLCQGRARTLWRLGGLLLCVLGAGFDIGIKLEGHSHVEGYLLMAVQVLTGCLYQILIKRTLRMGWPPLPLVAWSYTIGAVELVTVLGFIKPHNWGLKPIAAVTLVYGILFTSTFNYIAMATVNRRLGPTAVTSFFPLQTVLSALGQPFVGEPMPTIYDAGATGVVCCGLALFLRGESIPKPSKEVTLN